MRPNPALLLVEDHPIVAVLEQRQLARLGFEVTHVSTGEAAIEAVASMAEDLSLILMDIDLGPSMDGIEAARIIGALYDIPIIFLSSHDEPELVGRARQVPADGYVLKSAGIFTLEAAITAALKRHEGFSRPIWGIPPL
ncbi:MAG: response regulator [Acidobacteriota bacterium]